MELAESGNVQACDLLASPFFCQLLTAKGVGAIGGRRLLRRWLCRPLRDLASIGVRQDAVAELAARPGLAGPLRGGLRRLGDLERALGQVHV